MMQSKKEEIKFFDSRSEIKEYNIFKEYGWLRLKKEFEKTSRPSADDRIIDLGCGTGSFTRLINSNNVFGADISKAVILGKKFNKHINFMASDIENLCTKSESFDIVTLSAVLHHLDDMKISLKEVYRILKPGGKCFSFDPHYHNPFMLVYRCKKSPFYSSAGVTENEKLLKKKELKMAFKTAGFSDVKVYATSGVACKQLEGKTANMLLPVYNFIDYFFYRIPFLRRYGSVIITSAEK